MNEVMAAIPNPLMNASENLVGFLSFYRAFLRLRLPTACFGKGFFISAEETRILHKRTIRKGRELLQPDIDTDRFQRFR